MYFFRFFLFFPVFFSFNFCFAKQERNLSQGNLELSSRSSSVPSVFPERLFQKDDKIKWTGLYSSGYFLDADQGFVILERNKSIKEIHRYYQKILPWISWQVIQDQKKGEKILIVAEDPSFRLLSVILQDLEPVVVKLYIRLSQTY